MMITLCGAKMQIRLLSDYLDYYDQWFASNYETNIDYTLDRRARSPENMPKRDQFWLLSKHFQVPIYGLARDLPLRHPKSLTGSMDATTPVVVYTDQLAHQGEGKELMHAATAKRDYPDHLVAEFIGEPGFNPVSIRHLQVGLEAWNIVYKGSVPEDFEKYGSQWVWQSNNAPIVDVEYIGPTRPIIYEEYVKYPIFAIDFVQNHAVDFNTAPQIRGTGLEDRIAPKQMYEFIEGYIGMLKRREKAIEEGLIDPAQPERPPKL